MGLLDPPALSRTQSDARYGVQSLPAPNGTDDTAAIQAVITAGAKHVRGRPGSSYKLTAALVLPTGTTLDMTGCDVTLANGSGTRMVRNAGSSAAASATDGAATSGSAVVTTALASQAVVGQSLYLADAGGNGLGPLVGIISAISGNQLTLVTHDNRPCLASATVTGKTVRLHTRDRDIRVVGGKWHNGNNVPTSDTLGVLFFRHVDNLWVDIESADSTVSCRCIGIGAVRNYFISCLWSTTPGVTVQVNGPAVGGRIDYIGGDTADDLVCFAAGDYSDQQITAGEIVGATVGTIVAVNTRLNVFKVLAGSGRRVDAIKVEGGIFGSAGASGYAAYVGDDIAQPQTRGGAYGDIDLGLVAVRTPNQPVAVFGANVDRLKAVVRSVPVSGGSQRALLLTATAATTIGTLELDGTVANTTQAPIEDPTGYFTIKNLRVSESLTGFKATPATNAQNILAARVPLAPFVLGDAWARADGTGVGNAESGQAWTVWGGAPGIVSKQAAPTTASNTKIAAAAVADGYFEVTVNALAAAGEAYLLFRGVDTNNYFRFGWANSGANLIAQKIAAGAASGAATLLQPAFAAGARLGVLCSGASISFYVNGQLMGVGSDTFQQTATLVGWQAPDATARFGPIYARNLVGGA